MGGELQDNAEARAFTPADAESPRLSVSNAEMAAFQERSSGSVSVSDREQTMFAKGFDFSQSSDIYGRQSDNLIATRPELLETAKPQREAPKVGETTAVADFLEMASPVGNAYRSRRSHTLTSLVSEVERRPWPVNVVMDSSSRFQDYDAKESTIHLGTTWNDATKVDNFGHEAYHATHQDLDKLYCSAHEVNESEYLKIKMDQEAGAFLAEFKVNRELGHKPTSYEYAEGSEVKHQQIGNFVVYKDASKTVIDESASRAAIAKFIGEHHAPIRKPDGRPERNVFTGEIQTTYSYPKQHEIGYAQYVKHFDENRRNLLERGWLGKGY